MSSQALDITSQVPITPQANGEVERFNRTTQEAFLKCQEFSDKVKEADVDWYKKLNSILFSYRVLLNLAKLRSYIPQEFSTGNEYVKATQMNLPTTWATEVELFTCAQLSGKDVVCYFGKQWLRYPASGNQKKPARNAFFIANYGQHFTAVVGVK